WDSAQTPVLVDGEFNGRPRKLVLQASRNGYYFTLDRLTGEHLVTGKFGEAANWAKALMRRDSLYAIRRRISMRGDRWCRPPIKGRPTGRLRHSVLIPVCCTFRPKIATRCTISPRPT